MTHLLLLILARFTILIINPLFGYLYGWILGWLFSDSWSVIHTWLSMPERMDAATFLAFLMFLKAVFIKIEVEKK